VSKSAHFECNGDVTPVNYSGALGRCHNDAVIQRFSAAGLLFLLLLISAVFSSSQTNAEWVNEYYSHALDALMPLQKETGTFVAYRAHRDYRTDVPEYWFMIEYDRYGSEASFAHVRAADGLSIYDQLARLHQNDMQAKATSLAGKIKLKSWDFDEHNCPAIKKQVENFQALQFNPPTLEAKTIVFHPMNHELHVQAPNADMHVVIWDDDHPMVKWAMETRTALEKCVTHK
jgi:hypothetical protein